MPDTGIPSAIKCDTVGNVYAACGDGLNVWNSGGVLLGKVLISNGITGVCFGKPGELFLLNGTIFWIVTVANTVKGALLAQNGLGGEEYREGSVDSTESMFLDRNEEDEEDEEQVE